MSMSGDLEIIKKRLFSLKKFKYDFRKLRLAEEDRSFEFFSFYNKVKTELDENLTESPLKVTQQV